MSVDLAFTFPFSTLKYYFTGLAAEMIAFAKIYLYLVLYL